MSPRAAMNRRLMGVMERTIGRTHDPDALQAEVSAKFAPAGLSYEDACERLGKAFEALGRRPYDPRVDSIHWLLFAGLAAKQPNARVLEIGTFDGGFTRLLAELFPGGTIDTVELPADDPIYAQTYQRGEGEAQRSMAAKLATNTSEPNIRLHRCNSAFLLDHIHGPFDLVWVDGGHLYPEVAWDVAQSFHLCAPGGAVLVDDVMFPGGRSNDYVSTDSFAVVEYLAARTGLAPTYFMKRTSYRFAGRRKTRKHVAMFERPVGANQAD